MPRVGVESGDVPELLMAQDYAELERSARLLSPEERARLAEAMTESLRDAIPQDVEAEWEAEIKRRVEAYERGEATLIPAEEVFAKARRISGE
jgi:putative addiction module component (TIGR02574 family)